MMNKNEMVARIRNKHLTWGGVYIEFTRIDGEARPVEGWYVAFDGPALTDMYLTNKHPLGDESGDIITFEDCMGLR